MTPETVMDLAHRGMIMAFIVAGPALMATLIIGLVISLLQAATQVNEMTLSFIPKIIGVVVTMSVFGPFIMGNLSDFTRRLFEDMIRMAAM